MRRRILLCLALGLLSACRGDDATRPIMTDASSPNAIISDGSHCAVNGPGCVKGNPDFFFLPPLVPDPRLLYPSLKQNPDWNAGASNVDLLPDVDICQLDAVVNSQGVLAKAIDMDTPCKTGGYVLHTTLGKANVSRGLLDDIEIDFLRFLVSHYTSFAEPYYHMGWTVPIPSGTSLATKPPTFYRIAVSAAKKSLGVLDVEAVNNFTQLRNVKTGEFVPLANGLKVPINFRIERYALCEKPGVGPCGTAMVEDINHLDAPLKILAVFNKDAPDAPSGVLLGDLTGAGAMGTASARTAAGTTDPAPVPRTVTVKPCESFRDRGITDLPTFGPCVTVTIEPALTAPLTSPAVVFSCEVSEKSVKLDGLDAAQAERIALHKLIGSGEDQELLALAHEDPHCPPVSYSTTGTLHGMFAALAHGQLRAAAQQMAAMVAPKPLYAAARFIDLGGGGSTHFIDDVALGILAAPAAGAAVSSRAQAQAPAPGTTRIYSSGDFQFALPAKFEVDATQRAGTPGSTINVQVKVTDLAGAAVRNAQVRFAADQDGTVEPAVVTQTGNDGLASVAWKLGPAHGIHNLRASGRGIAGTNLNGPRGGSELVDPFQPLQTHWGDAADDDRPIRLATGSVVVSATTLGSVSGTVLTAIGGTPIAGATVTIGSATPVTTDSEGAFSIASVPGGTYSLTVTATNYLATTREDVVIKAGANTVVGTIPLVLTAGSISGTVVDAATGAVIRNAKVTVGESILYTDESGAFSVGGLAAGTYVARIELTGYLTASRGRIVVTPGVDTPLGTIRLTRVGLFGSSSGGPGAASLNPGSLFSINITTADASLIGATGLTGGSGGSEVSAIAFDPTTGILYGILGSSCFGAQLITIDPSTGVGTLVGILKGSGFDGTPAAGCFGTSGGSDALAFSSDGTLYAGGWRGGEGNVGGSLLKVDKATGAVLEMLPTTDGTHLSGLAFDASGALWASRGGNGSGEIDKINVATGATDTTLVLMQPTGAPDYGLKVSDLTFDSNGTLYASLPAENKLATIDLTTGVVTRIGSFGAAVNRISGLTIRR